MTILNTPFRSKYGFESPGFAVDSAGNVIVRTLSQTAGDTGVETPADYTIIEPLGGGGFIFSGIIGTTPDLSLYRDRTYIFELDLATQGFYLFEEDGTPYFNGLVHSDGSSSVDALGKSTGRLRWTIPLNCPSIIKYGNSTRSIQGTITVGDPIGTFSSVAITEDTQAIDINSGVLVVAGGAGIAKDLFVGGTLTTESLQLNGSGIAEISSGTNLALNAENRIILKVSDVLIGSIDSNGLSISLNNSSINNSVIGDVTPSTATFISASITETPVSANNVTNKSYVDNTVTTLAVAFGL
jgi:hypothetical protein